MKPPNSVLLLTFAKNCVSVGVILRVSLVNTLSKLHVSLQLRCKQQTHHYLQVSLQTVHNIQHFNYPSYNWLDCVTNLQLCLPRLFFNCFPVMGTNYSVSQKKSPHPRFSDIFPKWLGIFSPKFYVPIIRPYSLTIR